jgi:hypothetical protein
MDEQCQVLHLEWKQMFIFVRNVTHVGWMSFLLHTYIQISGESLDRIGTSCGIRRPTICDRLNLIRYESCQIDAAFAFAGRFYEAYKSILSVGRFYEIYKSI